MTSRRKWGGVCLKNLGVIKGKVSSVSLANPLRVSRTGHHNRKQILHILYLHDLTLIIPLELHSAKSMSTAYIIDKVARANEIKDRHKIKNRNIKT